jgi:hypothetical protein
MAIITDYTTLSSAVASYLDRSDLTAMIPNFIEAAEQQVYRRVKHRGVETEFTATTSSGAVALSGLTNFREMKWMRVSSTPGVFLEPMTVENLYRQFPDRSATTATPRAYARDGASLIFGPAAANSISLDGVYYALLPNLSASNTTNWFTSNAPEVLLYGALMHAEPYIIGDQRVPVWGSFFRDSFDAVQLEGKYENRTGSRRSVKVL